jgi:hypothetical protein
MDSHFIDRTRQSLDIRSIETAPLGLKPHHENRSPAQSRRRASVHDAALFLGGNGRLLLLLSAS